MEYYKNQGYEAKFSENDIWNSFFHYLIYKNIKKLYELGEITTAKENRFDDEFYEENQIAINKILNSLMDTNIKEYIEYIYKNSSKKLTEEKKEYRLKVLRAAEYLDNNQILIIMEYMIKDYIHRRRGFPDLMVWNDKELFFAEIKAGSDVLSRRQISAHKALLKAGIDVVLLTINKNKTGVQTQKNHYFEDREPAKTDYKGRYNLKLKNANTKSEHLKNFNDDGVIADFKKSFYDKSLNYFIAYINALDKEGINDLKDLYIDDDKLIKEEQLVKYLSIMAKGKSFEDKHMYKKAIKEYNETAEDEDNPRMFSAYYRLCICYSKLHDLESEFAVIKKIVNDDSVPKDKKRGFKRRMEKKLKRQEYMESDILCPKCEEEYLKYKIHKSTNTKMYKCGNCKHIIID